MAEGNSAGGVRVADSCLRKGGNPLGGTRPPSPPGEKGGSPEAVLSLPVLAHLGASASHPPHSPPPAFCMLLPKQIRKHHTPGFLCWLHPSEIPCFSSPLLNSSPFLDWSEFPVLQGSLPALTVPTRRLRFCTLRMFSEALSTPPCVALRCPRLSSCLLLPHPFKGRASSLSLPYP